MQFLRIQTLVLVSLVLLALATSGCRTLSASGTELHPGQLIPVPKASPARAAPITPAAQRPSGPMTLRTYYLYHLYPASERRAVQQGLARVLTTYTPAELREAEAEVLAYHHVVFSPTRWHHLERNHAVMHKYAATLRALCKLHHVPFLPVLGIVSWENSGHVDKTSWAGAEGLGQMTEGAVEQADEFAEQESQKLLKVARRKEYLAAITGDPEAMVRARALVARARRLDIRKVHKQMARAAGVTDERALPECNLEDVVVFFKYLLSCYGGRVDQAIGAYHQGVANTDDIIYAYLKRRDPDVAYPKGPDRSAFIQALNRYHVTYLALWNDLRTREMLNGLRTINGNPTTPANADMALGDESDIYIWKVLGSLCAYLAGKKHTAQMIKRYTGRQDIDEMRGLPMYTSLKSLRRGVDQGRLVRTTAPILDLGVAGGASPTRGFGKYSYYVTPELDGYLCYLVARLRQACGDQGVRLPVTALSDAWALSDGLPLTVEQRVHLRAVEVTVQPDRLSPREAHWLHHLLRRDYLMDRIYVHQDPGGRIAVCLNPRYGRELMELYRRYTAHRDAATAPRGGTSSDQRTSRTAPF